MHNGIYDTLEEVIDFYNNGGGSGLGIELENQTLPFDELKLNDQEKKDIIAFLSTLTDNSKAKDIPKELPALEKGKRRLVMVNY
jgi:cytochrome c peroxidase